MAGQPVISLPPNGGQPAGYAPPPFLVPPPQFIPPQTAPPSIINYVSGPNGPTFPANFQSYQGYNPPVQVNIVNLSKRREIKKIKRTGILFTNFILIYIC